MKFEIIHSDFTGVGLPKPAEGYTQILMRVERSGSCTIRNATLRKIMEVLIERWVPYYGVHETIRTDRVQAFRSEFAQERHQKKPHVSLRTSNHAKIGSVTRDLGSYLRLYVNEKPRWDELGFVFSHNITPRMEKNVRRRTSSICRN